MCLTCGRRKCHYIRQTCLLSFWKFKSSKEEWRRQWHPTPVLLPEKSHGWKSLVGCSAWGRSESDTTERFHFHFSLSCIGEGNGNPLQCSCLENPRDGGAWWAAVYGVAQSRTRLKRLSSSSSSSGKLLFSTGSSAQCCVELEGWDGACGREAPQGEDLCILTADSHCSTAEINTTL